jgi:ribosomal protein L37AE/L43A
MPDYEKTKIYTVRSPHTNLVYVGATTQKYLSDRFASHKSHYKQWKAGKFDGCKSRVIFEFGDAYIHLEENYPCADKNESNARERYWIENYGELSVNSSIPGRTRKEYQADNREAILARRKQYYVDNRESISARQKQYHADNREAELTRKKQYREDNKEAISARMKQKITCPHCNRTHSRGVKARHLRTKVCRAVQARAATTQNEDHLNTLSSSSEESSGHSKLDSSVLTENPNTPPGMTGAL